MLGDLGQARRTREELKTTLAEMTYTKLAQSESELVEATKKIQESVPLTVFVG